MPYREQVTVQFPADDHRNVMLVFGDNMRGKTSLMNALRWGFYGKALGRHSRQIALHDLVNRDGARQDDWDMEVFLKFIAEGHEYQLRRTASRKPHVATPMRQEDFLVATHLTRDGIVIAGDQIEAEINRFAPEQVARFFLFDGELLAEYEELLIEGSEQGRQIKEAIEQVLGVPALTNGRVELGAILKTAIKKQTADMARVEGLQRSADNINALSQTLESQERDLETLQKKLSETKNERNGLEDELEKAASLLAFKTKLDNARQSAAEAAATLKRKSQERHNLLASAWRDLLSAKLDARRQIIRRKQSEANELLKQQIRVEQRIQDAEAALRQENCPTCEQAFPLEKREALGAHLAELEYERKRLGESDLATKDYTSELAVLDDIRGTNALERLIGIDKDIRAAEVQFQRAENDIERAEQDIAGHDTASLARKRVLHQEKLKEEGRLTESIKQVETKITKTNEDLAVAQRAIEGLTGARRQGSTLKARLVTELEACFAESVERLRDKLRERVQDLANESFKKMTTQASYRGLEINENYGLKIIDSNGQPVSIRSAGAEQVVALSLIDGLNRTGRSTGPVIMDTPFGRLDPSHRDNILRYLPTVTTQFVLMVHDGEIRPDTDLASVRSRIGASYRIQEVSENQSRIERITL